MSKVISLSLITFIVTNVWAENNVHINAQSLMTNALRIGVNTNGTVFYLCQGQLFNSVQPGKTWSGYQGCNVPYRGKEYVLDQFTIPNQREFAPYYWDRSLDSAVVVGNDTEGKPLFLCQSHFNGSTQPGKTWPGYNHCNISYAGREVITDNYLILAQKRILEVHSQQQANRHAHY